MDIAYNAGSLARAAPTLTYYAVNGLWSAAIAELRDWNHGRPDPLQNRHRDQANLLERALNAGRLPPTGCTR
jgi:GH24 family phage-related lysozyme (muramidase)